jgi:hypothetical protein
MWLNDLPSSNGKTGIIGTRSADVTRSWPPPRWTASTRSLICGEGAWSWQGRPVRGPPGRAHRLHRQPLVAPARALRQRRHASLAGAGGPPRGGAAAGLQLLQPPPEELKAGLAGGTSPGDVRSHDIAGPDAWEPAARRRRARSCQGRHARSGRGRPEVSAPGIVPPVAPEPRLPGAGPLLGLQPHAPGLSGCGVGWCVLRRIWPCGRASVVPSRCRMKVQFHR